jgi:hypothetical protein
VLWTRNFLLWIRIRIRIRLSNGLRIRIQFQQVPDPVSDLTFFLKKYEFEGPQMVFYNKLVPVLFKEYRYRYLNLVYIKMVKIIKLLLFSTVFVNVYIHFRIWTRIRNPRITDPDTAIFTDSCGSGSTTQ